MGQGHARSRNRADLELFSMAELHEKLKTARERDELAAQAELVRRLVNSVDHYVTSLEQETKLLTLSNEARLIEARLLKLERAGIARSSEAFKAAETQIRESVFKLAGADVFRETRTSFETFNAEVERSQEILKANAISGETFARRIHMLREQLDSSKASTSSMKSVVEELGLTFTSAFGNALVKGSRHSEVLKGLEQDLLRIGTRKLVTENLADSVSNLASAPGISKVLALLGLQSFAGEHAGLPAVDALLSLGGAPWPFLAQGGVVGPRGVLPLRRYSSGGIADSPQLAVFGEGAQREAFVPLPDGRAIPVVIRSGGGMNPVNITNHNSVPVTRDTANHLAVIRPCRARGRNAGNPWPRLLRCHVRSVYGCYSYA
jgi:hypothetical protein